MLARCRAKGALTGLSPNLQLTEKALPTRSFVEWWGRAFPSRQALPAEPLHDAAGHPTIAFHRVFR